MKLKYVIVGLVVYTFFLLGVLLIFQCIFTQSSKMQPKAYITVWDNQILKTSFLFRELLNGLDYIGHGTYEVVGRAPRYQERCVNEHDLNIVIWKRYRLPDVCMKEQSYLWQMESPISIAVPPSKAEKEHFNKIFTYHKASANGRNIIHVPLSYDYRRVLKNYDLKSKEYLVSLVGKYSELHHYKLRQTSIVWFLKNHPEDIRFFGHDWQGVLKYLSVSEQEKFKTQYGGYIPDKISEISKSKFVLAYENFRFDDYVTEKIYDVMAAGSVPIYSGAPNITEYVPQSCFIDFHAFQSHEELYDFLANMSDDTYNDYLDCIKDFMAEPESHPNHYKNVAQIILYHMTE